MKEFWSSIIAIVVIVIVSSYALDALNMSSQNTFTTSSVRH